MNAINKTTIGLIGAVLISTANANLEDKMKIYDLPQSKLHVYASGDAMGDVSFIIEGKKIAGYFGTTNFLEKHKRV